MFEQHKQKAILKAMVKKLPLVKYIRSYKTRGTDDALYCYSIWMRHLIMYQSTGNSHPNVVAELGPGDSIGVVLAALITGAKKVYAFDVKNKYNPDLNLSIFNRLVELFRQKARIPGPEKYPRAIPNLNDYEFPSHIISDLDLVKLLAPDRIESIRMELLAINKNYRKPPMIVYQAPWDLQQNIDKNCVDLIISQAVMEHVLDIQSSYDVMNQWLKTGGVISHSIDFKSHGTSSIWNGHWFYNSWEWKLVEDDEGPAINRTSFLDHILKVKKMEFEIIKEITVQRNDGFTFEQFKQKFPKSKRREEEIITESIYLLATKK